MEDFSKIIEEKNRNMTFEEYKEKGSEKQVKESKFGKFISTIIFWPIHAIVAFFGIDKDSVLSSKTPGHGGGGHVSHSSSSGASFRQEHSFNPERAYIERIQERAYMQMVDGKGDPEHCDCDHDR